MKKEEYISDDQVVKRARAAVRIELEKKKELNLPVVVYDRKTKTIYKINGDGTKEKLGNGVRKGRYSERVSKQA